MHSFIRMLFLYTYSHLDRVFFMDFGFPIFRLSLSSVVLAQGHTAAPSVSMASSCPPAVSRSFTVPPCGLSSQPTRLCLWCGGARALSAVSFLWCWITLGPARSLHYAHNSPLAAALLPAPGTVFILFHDAP